MFFEPVRKPLSETDDNILNEYLQQRKKANEELKHYVDLEF